jgi:hypothetical protein
MVVMPLKMAARSVLALLVVYPAVAASGTVVISGSIPCMGQIALADSASGSSSSVVAMLRPDENNRATVTLRLRTNCRFHVISRLRAPSDGEAQVVSGAVTAPGGTGHLTAKALETAVKAVTIPAGFPANCVEGPAISRGGNNTTPDNAVLVEVVLQLPDGVRTASAEFSLMLGN